MKVFNIIIICVFISYKVYGQKISNNENIITRLKREFSDSEWGYFDWTSPQPSDIVSNNRHSERLLQTTTTTTTTQAPVTTSYRPCDPYSPQRPDYSAPNRRISEVKCYEYIWDLKARIEKDKRRQDCTIEELRKQGSYAVISGYDARTGEFPHMAAIGWKATSEGPWIFKCGGSLLSANVVLTAGHCTRASSLDTTIADTRPKIVRLGDKNIVEPTYKARPLDVNISAILQHPLYSPPKKYNDIALMQLEKNVEFTATIHPACMWPYFDTQNLGTKATVTGWGVIKSGALKTSPNLQAAVVDLIPSDQCNNLLERFCNRHWCGLENHQLCAGTLAGGADSCQGDSGGPLQVRIPLPDNILGAMHYVIGITSFGIQCGRPNSPGVYTRVSSYVDWIESVVWPNTDNRYSTSNTHINYNQASYYDY